MGSYQVCSVCGGTLSCTSKKNSISDHLAYYAYCESSKVLLGAKEGAIEGGFSAPQLLNFCLIKQKLSKFKQILKNFSFFDNIFQ